MITDLSVGKKSLVEKNFKKFAGIQNQLAIANEKFNTEGNFSPVQMPTIWKDMDERFNLANRVVDIVDRSNREICVTLLQWNVDEQESSYARARFFAWKTKNRGSTYCLC